MLALGLGVTQTLLVSLLSLLSLLRGYPLIIPLYTSVSNRNDGGIAGGISSIGWRRACAVTTSRALASKTSLFTALFTTYFTTRMYRDCDYKWSTGIKDGANLVWCLVWRSVDSRER